MARAKMSDREARQAMAHVRANTQDARITFAAADAEREALSILAETEPHDGQMVCLSPLCFRARVGTQWTAAVPAVWAGALAASLAAFVEG